MPTNEIPDVENIPHNKFMQFMELCDSMQDHTPAESCDSFNYPRDCEK